MGPVAFDTYLARAGSEAGKAQAIPSWEWPHRHFARAWSRQDVVGSKSHPQTPKNKGQCLLLMQNTVICPKELLIYMVCPRMSTQEPERGKIEPFPKVSELHLKIK